LEIPDAVDIFTYYYEKTATNGKSMMDLQEVLPYLSHKSMDICKHVALMFTTQGYTDIPLDTIHIDILDMLLKSNKCTFIVNSFPCLDKEKNRFIRDHSNLCKIVKYDFVTAANMGDVELIKYTIDLAGDPSYHSSALYWMFSLNAQMFDYIQSRYNKLTDGDFLAHLGNLELVKHVYNNHPSIPFTWRSMRAPVHVLEFLLESMKRDNRLPAFNRSFINDQGVMFKSPLTHHLYKTPSSLDYKQLMLLIDTYGVSEINFRDDSILFLNSISANQLDIVKYLIQHDYVDFDRLSRVPTRFMEVFYGSINNYSMFKYLAPYFKDKQWFKTGLNKYFKADWGLKIINTITSISSDIPRQRSLVLLLKEMNVFEAISNTRHYIGYFNEMYYNPLMRVEIAELIISDIKFRSMDFIGSFMVFAMKQGNYPLCQYLVNQFHLWTDKLNLSLDLAINQNYSNYNIYYTTCQRCVSTVLDLLPITSYHNPYAPVPITTLSLDILDRFISRILSLYDANPNYLVLVKLIEYSISIDDPNIKETIANIKNNILSLYNRLQNDIKGI